MSINTHEECNKTISGWLNENGHEIKLIDDEGTNFHFEIDYPLGSMKKQRVLQPKDYPWPLRSFERRRHSGAAQERDRQDERR